MEEFNRGPLSSLGGVRVFIKPCGACCRSNLPSMYTCVNCKLVNVLLSVC